MRDALHKAIFNPCIKIVYRKKMRKKPKTRKIRPCMFHIRQFIPNQEKKCIAVLKDHAKGYRNFFFTKELKIANQE